MVRFKDRAGMRYAIIEKPGGYEKNENFKPSASRFFLSVTHSIQQNYLTKTLYKVFLNNILYNILYVTRILLILSYN